MSQNSVIKLKELLFDKESDEIRGLAARLEEVAARAGSDASFRRSVAATLDGALREAEATNHRPVADALAPLVVRTVRTEVEASADALPAKLYPHIGVMVRDYVRSAIRDLMEDINRRLEQGLTQNRVMLRLRSWTTGRSMAELALADTGRFQVDELHLIRRGSGELLAHWVRPTLDGATAASDDRDALVGGLLTAMTAFIEEVYEADKAGLRTIDFGAHTIYLRGSPIHLLAARCRGEAGAGVQMLLDEEFLRTLEEENGTPGAPDLAALAARLENGIATREEQHRKERTRSGLRPLRALLWLIGLALAAYFGWQAYTSYQTSTLQAAVDRVIAETPDLKGYPARATVMPGGERIEVSGLAPSGDTRTSIVARLKAIAPKAVISEAIGVVPGAENAGLANETARLREQLTAIQSRLASLATTVDGIATSLGETARSATVETQLQEVRRQLADLAPKPDAGRDLETWMQKHAIFFSDGTEVRDQGEADETLDALAALMRRTTAPVRVVGYTDERGTNERNLTLAMARAEKIVAELAQRGIHAARLRPVGRAAILDISARSGVSSPNRRVTFEPIFVGEAP